MMRHQCSKPLFVFVVADATRPTAFVSSPQTSQRLTLPASRSAKDAVPDPSSAAGHPAKAWIVIPPAPSDVGQTRSVKRALSRVSSAVCGSAGRSISTVPSGLST
jgi:hypothetical protein